MRLRHSTRACTTRCKSTLAPGACSKSQGGRRHCPSARQQIAAWPTPWSWRKRRTVIFQVPDSVQRCLGKCFGQSCSLLLPGGGADGSARPDWQTTWLHVATLVESSPTDTALMMLQSGTSRPIEDTQGLGKGKQAAPIERSSTDQGGERQVRAEPCTAAHAGNVPCLVEVPLAGPTTTLGEQV